MLISRRIKYTANYWLLRIEIKLVFLNCVINNNVFNIFKDYYVNSSTIILIIYLKLFQNGSNEL